MRRLTAATLAAVVVTLMLTGVAAAQQSIQAYVTRIVDGDTIYAVIGGRTESIRYIGINTPETHHPTRGREPGGEAATEVNRRLVDGRWVTLVLDVQHRDKYGDFSPMSGSAIASSTLSASGLRSGRYVPTQRALYRLLREAGARGAGRQSRAVAGRRTSGKREPAGLGTSAGRCAAASRGAALQDARN